MEKKGNTHKKARASKENEKSKEIEEKKARIGGSGGLTVRVIMITGSLATLENLFPQNYRYRYRLEIRMNSFNYHYRYRLGVRSHPFISIDSQSRS